MRTRLSGSFVMAGLSLLLLSSCVSSKKYKTSQATLQRVRDDSAKLAQQVTTLNGNVQDMQQKNASLQQSLDKTSGDLAAQQKTVAYYHDYFDKQQSAATQLTQQLKDACTQAGLPEQNMELTNGVVYVNLDENAMFKKNSSAVTPEGKKALTNIAQVFKSRDDINVAIDNTGASGGAMASTNQGTMSSGTTTMSDNTSSAPVAKKVHHWKPRKSSEEGTTASGTATAKSSTGSSTSNGTVAVHKRVHRKYSTESSSYTYTNGMNGMSSKQRNAWALKSGRVNTVARGMLVNGVQKVSIVVQQPSATTDPAANNIIQVVVTPKMKDINPQGGAVTSAGSDK